MSIPKAIRPWSGQRKPGTRGCLHECMPLYTLKISFTLASVGNVGAKQRRYVHAVCWVHLRQNKQPLVREVMQRRQESKYHGDYGIIPYLRFMSNFTSSPHSSLVPICTNPAFAQALPTRPAPTYYTPTCKQKYCHRESGPILAETFKAVVPTVPHHQGASNVYKPMHHIN